MPTDIDYDEIYQSKWIKADDIGDEDLILTIKDVNAQEVGADREMKLILSFGSMRKGSCSIRPTRKILRTASVKTRMDGSASALLYLPPRSSMPGRRPLPSESARKHPPQP